MESSVLRLNFKNQNPWHVSAKAFSIVAVYIQPFCAISAKEAALALDQLTPMRRRFAADEPVEGPDSFRLEFWETFARIVRQVPFNHTSQDKLVELVAELEDLPPASDNMDHSIWRNLPSLANTLDFMWNPPSWAEDTYEPFTEWVNLNSFTARIFGIGLLQYSILPIWTLRHALEDEEVKTHRDVVECNILTAVQWIQHSGAVLLHIMIEVSPNEAECRAYESQYFSGDEVFSVERWNFWKRKLQGVNDLCFSNGVKFQANRAVRRMDMLQQILNV